MEENITQRKTNTLSIAFIAGGLSEGFPAQLSQFIAPDGKEAREFIFTISDSITASVKELAGKDLVVFVTEEGATANATLLKALEKEGANYILAETTGDTESLCRGIVLSLEKALDMGFSIEDFVQIYTMGIPVDTIRKHLVIFRNGIASISLEKPAILNDGIKPLPDAAAREYAAYFDEKKNGFKLKKFVPASGAASRMFKFLSEFMAEFKPETETINAYINRKNATALSIFLAGIDKFPFFKEVYEAIKQAPEYADWSKNQRYYHFIKTMLDKGSFDYANKPKGILPFHQYEDFTATPVYEHLKEAVSYAASNNEAYVHFTISEEHLNGFLDAIEEVKAKIEEASGISIKYNFSCQQKETDTIAVDLNNMPFRDSSGRLLFRPGGHGALIQNLNRLSADIVFIKNIDNVSYNHTDVISLYKKALGGILIKTQEKVHGYLQRMAVGEITEECIKNIFAFAKEELCIDIPQDVAKYTFENKIEYLRDLLNRPVRVCGMVKNEGEPGGGPFWVKGEKGRLSLQIIESSQIDLDNKEQQKIMAASTHFNPVDVVCGLRDYQGNRFNLNDFVDASTGFIVYKNKNGRDVKSYELPGLWNGAMAGWITLFVEEPLETFNPVKTVNDLLKPAHQPQ
ncbi:ATPase [Flavobacterium cyanobacteriorum]|uniref:ATPase n=1 Tax=Flavobacterium cyanobacteriorum TaxID=2022802 RepID=A0A255ZB09_9FLAO|nr:DUF4301 family protein [Flavobacterium cyanobacteriorum]OYQ38639.1 ATPase [Flavobacterium cyanobacteriorum]